MAGNKRTELERRRFLSAVAAGILGGGEIKIGYGMSAVSAWTGVATNSVLNQVRPLEKSLLKIAKVEPLVLRVHADGKGGYSGNHYLMCRVETEDGLVGWGEGTNFPKPAPIAAELEMMKPWVIGQSAWDIEKIWHLLYRRRAAMHGSAVQSAISCVDIALWDIVGQRLGVPVFRLLGGRIHDKIPIYTSYRWGPLPRTAAAYARRTRELAREGARAGKWDPFFDHKDSSAVDVADLNRQVSLKTVGEVREMVRGVREGGGPEFEICVEAHAKFNVGSAIRIAKAIEASNPMFLEEPVPPEHVDEMIEVQRATSIPIAAGERLKSRQQAREYIERNAFRIYQPDVARMGGITEFRKATAMAESHLIPVAPHNPNGPVCLAAHLHLCAAMSNLLLLEEGDTRPPACRDWFGAWEESRSHFPVLEQPGLGIKLAPDYVRTHAVDIAKAL